MKLDTSIKQILLGVIVGLGFALLAWVLDIVASGYDFSLSSLIRIHKENTLHFLIDLLPVAFATASYLLGKSLASRNEWGSSQELELLHRRTTEVTKSFLSGEPPVSVFADMLDHLLEMTGSEFGFIGDVLYDDDGMPYLKSRAITDIAWDQASKDVYRPEGMEFRNLNSLFGHVLTKKEVVLANDPRSDWRSAGTPHGHPPLDSFLGVPLMHGDQLIGMIGLANRPDGFEESIVNFIDPLISACGNVLWGMRLTYNLEGARRRYQDLFDEAPLMYMITRIGSDKSVVVKECNALFCQMLGYDNSEIIGRPISEFLTAESREIFLDTGFATSTTVGATRDLVAKDGSILHTELVAIPDIGDDGTVMGSRAMFIDVTKLVEAHSKQEHISADLSQLIDLANAPIFGIDKEGLVNEWNQQAAKISGRSKADMLGLNLLDSAWMFASPEKVVALHDLLLRALDGEETSNFEFSLTGGPGETVDLLLNTTARRDIHGAISGVLVVGLDISERTKAERIRIEKDRQHRRLTDELPVSIWDEDWTEVKLELDKLGFKRESDLADYLSTHPNLLSELNYMTKIIEVNPYTYELYELFEEDGRRITPDAIDNTFLTDRGRSLARLYFHDGDLTENYNVRSHKDNVLNIQSHTMIANDAKEDWSRVITIDQDRTELMHKEQELLRAQKMQAIGQLTGGVAHDFNNLLNIIAGNVRFLRDDMGQIPKETEELFEDIRSATKDGAELTRSLLAFSRNDSLRPIVVNVNTKISKFSRFLSRTLGDGQKIEVELPADNLFIKIDSAQFDNALLNLAVNARDAMCDGGVIRISARRSRRYPVLSSSSECSKADYVCISVTDSGVGIDNEIMDRVFDPYFTTKELGKGSGLGLSMVYGFADQSGGWCEIESSSEDGTTVSMFFPVVESGLPVAADAEDTIRERVRKGGTILVVEDEPRVRRVALRHVGQMGFSTLEAENADVAKSIIESGKHIDVLFSDIMMPGEMDGKQLAAWVDQHHPHIRVILTSGFVEEDSDSGSEASRGPPVLTKPYSAADIAKHIAAL